MPGRLVSGRYLVGGVADGQRAQGVVGQRVAAPQGHLVGAVFLEALFRPVLLTFGLWGTAESSVGRLTSIFRLFSWKSCCSLKTLANILQVH